MKNNPTETNLFRAKDVERALAELEQQQKQETQSLKDYFAKLTTASASQKGILLGLVGASVANTFVLGVIDVIAVSGFIGDTGIVNLPWLWVGELLLNFFISTIIIQIIDKIPRLKMMKRIIAALCVTYFAVALLFVAGIPTKLLYPLMYLIYAQQSILFPMIFWNLANQVYNLSDAKRLFPFLASGELLGRLLGYSLFTLTGLFGYAEISDAIIINPAWTMAFSGLLYIIGYIIFTRIPKPDARMLRETKTAFIENIKSSFDTIREVPFFQYMAMLVALTWVALTILLYNFYASLDSAAAEGLQFQTLYSIYNITVLTLPLAFQWTLGDDLLERGSPKTGYLVLPFTLLVSVALIFIFPTILGSVGALFIAMIIYRGWYMPLYQSLYQLVPQERRGRIRGLLGSYSYIFGSLLGAAFTGGALLLVSQLGLDHEYARVSYLLAALLAAITAIYIAFRIRATYEDSLLSWHIAPRKRTSSVFDKLDS